MKEYKNIKIYKHNKWSPEIYDADLWIDDKFIQHVTLDECTFRYNVLMEKLNSMVYSREPVNIAILDEIEEVMQLKYEEGTAEYN